MPHRYDDLILLCAADHRMVDAQPETYPAAVLQARKRDHERWVEQTLEIKVKPDPGAMKNMLASQKSVYEQVVCDSGIEATFADQLEKNTAIKVYVKLPGWFEVPTPLGKYNPDWAVLVQTDAGDRLYLVVETKSSLFTDDLRDREGAKITYGRAHFSALRVSESPAEYVMTRSFDDVLTHIGGT